MFDRLISLIGNTNYEKIKSTKILLVGIGGVGGFTLESLIRSGFENITIIDYDIVEKSNINRQLVATNKSINNKKIDIALNHANDINLNHHIKALDIHLDENSMNVLDNDYDYIIDACDTLNTKVLLIKYAKANNIKIISCMGMGNRIDGSKVKITTLNKTINDSLAKKLRKILKEEIDISKVHVVASEELAIKKDGVYSIITPPSIAGILMTNYVINDLINF